MSAAPMFRFQARRGITAWFADLPLGTVEVDIGAYDAPEEPALQCYVYSHCVRRDLVRVESGADLSSRVGRLGLLRLHRLGAEYRVEAVLTEQHRLDAPHDAAGAHPPRFSQRFEAEGPAVHVPSARERHGVDHLGCALLLDALRWSLNE